MNYVGIDFHKSYSFITEMDEAGKISHQAKITNDCATLKNYLAGLSPGVELQRSLEKTGVKLVETLGLCASQKKGKMGCPEGGKDGRHNSDSGSSTSVN